MPFSLIEQLINIPRLLLVAFEKAEQVDERDRTDQQVVRPIGGWGQVGGKRYFDLARRRSHIFQGPAIDGIS